MLKHLILNYMIELTTGIVFLLTSLYGSNIPIDEVSTVEASNIATAVDNGKNITVTTNRKAIEKYLRENFSDTPILIEIARCESTFVHYDKNGDLMRGKANNADVGVMQINEKYHLETATKLGFDIHTIEGNVNYAKYLYDKYGAEPWSASSPCWGSKIVAMNK
jgi:hypothetical protein